MTLRLRYYFDVEDTLTYYEFGEDGYARRQVDLPGPEQRPVTAATLEEVLHARDHGGFEAAVAYERKYGIRQPDRQQSDCAPFAHIAGHSCHATHPSSRALDSVEVLTAFQ